MDRENAPSEPPLAYAGPSVLGPVAVRAPGESLKWIYLGLLIVTVLTWIAFHAAAYALPWTLWTIGNDMARASMVVTGIFWVHQSWSGLPAWQRGERAPFRMAIQLLVPFYDVYWAFVVHAELCRALDDVLVRASDPRRAPRILAALAPTVYFGVDAFGIIMRFDWRNNWEMYVLCGCSYVVWLVYMFRCDRSRRAVSKVVEGMPPSETRSAHGGGRTGLSVRTSVALIATVVGVMMLLQLLGPAPAKPF